MELIHPEKIDNTTANGDMPLENFNLRISDKEIDTYQKTVLAHYRTAQAIYSADIRTLEDSITEIKAKIASLTRSWKAFHQEWANIRRFNQMVWSDPEKATTLAIKTLHTTQILRVLGESWGDKSLSGLET